jgi:hypothetical protein
MPAQNDTRLSAKEIVQQRWQAHRQAYLVSGFQPKSGGAGVVVVDKTVRPPDFFVATQTPDGFRAFRGLLGADAVTRDMPRLIDDISEGRIEGDLIKVPFDAALRHLGLVGEDVDGLAATSVRRFMANLGDPRLAAKLPRDGLIASEAKRLDAAGLGAFKALFRADALAALSATDTFMLKHYAFFAADGVKGDIRRAAAGHYPLFTSFMVERFSVGRALDAQVAEKAKTEAYLASDEHQAKLASPIEKNGETRSLAEWMRIEGRDPAAPWQLSEKAVRQALMAAFGRNEQTQQPNVPNHVIAGLRGVDWPTNGVPLDTIVNALAQLPADWMPKNRMDWDAFCNLTATVGKIVPYLCDTPLRVLYEGCQGEWAAYQDRLMRAFQDGRLPEGCTEADVACLKSEVDWAALEVLPRDMLEAASINAASLLTTLSPAINQEETAAYIRTRVAPNVSRDAVMGAALEIEEMVSAFTRKIVLPTVALAAMDRSGTREFTLPEQHHVSARIAGAKIIMQGKSAVRLFEATRQYINRAGELLGAGEDDIGAKARDEAKDAARERILAESLAAAIGINPAAPPHPSGWAPLCPIVKAPNGVYIVPLTNPDHLQDEGRGYSSDSPRNADGSLGLQICVGTGPYYASRCQRDGEHILSLRHIGGENGANYTRMSCIQIVTLTKGSLALVSHQHRGKGNVKPPEDALKAWEWFESEVAAGRVPLNLDGIQLGVANARAAKTDEIALNCGYEWASRKRVARATETWSAFLNKKHRKMSPEQFAADADLAHLVDVLDPQMVPSAARR